MSEKPDIGLIYAQKCFEEPELTEMKSELAERGLELNCQEQSPYINASLDFFVPVVNIILSPEMVSGLLSATAWDAIKWLLKKVVLKLKDKTFYKITTETVTKKTGYVHFRIGKNILVLSPDLDEKKFEKAIDSFQKMVVASIPHETTYCLYSDGEETIIQKTETDIIREEYEKHSNGNSSESEA